MVNLEDHKPTTMLHARAVRSRRTLIRLALFAASILGGSFAVNSSVLAQAATDRVTVDLSVISDGGVGPGVQSGRNLMVPPATTPRSTLHVAPKNRIKLRAPAAKPMAKKTPAEKAPAPKKAAKKVAAAKPAAPPAAPKPAAKQQEMKKPEPKKPAETAKAASVAPPPPPPAAKVPAPPAPALPTATKAPPPPAVSTTPPPTAPKPATESASAPAAIELKPGRALRIAFAETNTKVAESDQPSLLALSSAIKGSNDFRLQLLAYAGGKDLSTSKARRMSLSRALAVRSFLIENGVRSTQIDVRALGNKTTEKPVNRVDVNIARR